MKLKIEIEMNNSAFDSCNSNEAARILEEAMICVDGRNLEVGDGGNLRDFNGNTVGEWKVTR